MHVISIYAPQVGLDEETKMGCWDSLEEFVHEIPSSDKVFLGGDLNGHVGKDRLGMRGFMEVNTLGFVILGDFYFRFCYSWGFWDRKYFLHEERRSFGNHCEWV